MQKDNNEGRYSIIREQGEFMDPKPLSEEEERTVKNSEKKDKE